MCSPLANTREDGPRKMASAITGCLPSSPLANIAPRVTARAKAFAAGEQGNASHWARSPWRTWQRESLRVRGRSPLANTAQRETAWAEAFARGEHGVASHCAGKRVRHWRTIRCENQQNKRKLT